MATAPRLLQMRNARLQAQRGARCYITPEKSGLAAISFQSPAGLKIITRHAASRDAISVCHRCIVRVVASAAVTGGKYVTRPAAIHAAI